MQSFLSRALIGASMVALATPALAQEKPQPNSQQFIVKDFFLPDGNGQLNEFRAAGFAQPAAPSVTPRLWVLPVMSVDPNGLKFYDANGIPFFASASSDKLAFSISVPLKYNASLPDQRKKAAIGAALKGETINRWTTHWLAGPNMPFVHQPVLGDPNVVGMVQQAYQQRIPLYQSLEQAGAAYQGYQAQAATLNEVSITLLVDGEPVARRDYKGSLINYGSNLPALTIVGPTLYQQNKIAAGDFEINVGFRFLDAKTSVVEGKFEVRQVLDQFVEETQKAKTKSSSSGWQVLGFGSRRSRLKTSLEQNFSSNTQVEQMQGTRIVTYDATESMLEKFEASFFPEISKQQVMDRHLAAAAEARASGNEQLAKIHTDYAAALLSNDGIKEVDIEKAAAALSKKDYAGFIAHGTRFSQSDATRTDNFRRVINTEVEINERKEWLDYRTTSVQRETTVPITVEADRKWKAALGLCEAGNYTIPFAEPWAPLRPQAVTVLSCVEPTGPLQRAGFQPGMLVIDFDGVAVTSVGDIDDLLASREPGDSILVRYIDIPASNAQQTAVASKWVTLGRRP